MPTTMPTTRPSLFLEPLSTALQTCFLLTTFPGKATTISGRPSGWVDGHPASSKWNSSGLALTATTDEGGGYYDSGYIQTLNYFGDGTRILLTSLFEAPVLTSGLSRAALYFRLCARAVLLVTAYSLSGGLRNHFTHSKSEHQPGYPRH
jgi:hypothetical protein